MLTFAFMYSESNASFIFVNRFGFRFTSGKT